MEPCPQPETKQLPMAHGPWITNSEDQTGGELHRERKQQHASFERSEGLGSDAGPATLGSRRQGEVEQFR